MGAAPRRLENQPNLQQHRKRKKKQSSHSLREGFSIVLPNTCAMESRNHHWTPGTGRGFSEGRRTPSHVLHDNKTTVTSLRKVGIEYGFRTSLRCCPWYPLHSAIPSNSILTLDRASARSGCPDTHPWRYAYLEQHLKSTCQMKRGQPVTGHRRGSE
ncbi:hypothetical protein OG21DRAFT_942508 [Imleria badia]|nr:hypothetical protein OG21DRAFT_942508 [Imleria badia]